MIYATEVIMDQGPHDGRVVKVTDQVDRYYFPALGYPPARVFNKLPASPEDQGILVEVYEFTHSVPIATGQAIRHFTYKGQETR